MAEKTLQKIDVFISSPGDVGEERRIASEVIEKLNLSPYIADCCKLKPLAYEKIVPAACGETPQRTVDRYMMEADQADIFICILWSKMGTPVIDEKGKEYHSGTEYEFSTAYRAYQQSGKPDILLYRSMKNFPIDADLRQVELVRAFFKSFEGKEADLKGFYKKYQNNDEFKETLHNDLERIISKIIPPAGAGKPAYFPAYSPSELPAYPPQLKDFVTQNRSEELIKALTYLQDHCILLISGIGGVGKTTLARALIETRPADVALPFWFDFGKKQDATLGDVLEKLAGYMNKPELAGFRAEKREAGQDNINRLTGELQRREQLWLVFDNLDTILDKYSKFRDEGMDNLFTSMRGSMHNAKIIVTSRILPLLNNGESLIDVITDEKRELKGLKLNFAVDFLDKNGLEGLERKKLEELASGVDGHPLALRLLIELVKKFGISDTLKDLGMFQRRKEDTIKKARRLFEKLAGDEKELLENISVFRKPESMDAIKAMFTQRTSEDAIEKLMDKSLLETDRKGSYWLHPLIREFSYEDLKKKKEVHQRAFSYYRSLKLPEKRTKKDDVLPLIEACYHACKAEEYDEAASIIFDHKLNEDLNKWGEYRTLIELYSGLLPEDHFSDNILLIDKGTHGVVLGNLGSAYSALGQVAKAIQYFEQALDIDKEIGNRKGEGKRLGKLGIAYSALGQVHEAIQYYEKALNIAMEIGDRRGEGARLGNLGNAYYSLGQVEKAIQYYEKAFDIAREIGDRRNEGAWLGNLGNAYSALDQVAKAIQYYEKALTISQEIGDRGNEGAVMGNLGLAYSALCQVAQAIQYYEKALSIAREIGDRRGEATRLGNLGLAYSGFGQVNKAIKYHEQALAIAQEIGDRRNEGAVMGNLGNSYSALGQVEKAIRYYEQALVIAREIGDRRGEATRLGNLGLAYSAFGQVNKAIKYHEQALALAVEIGDRRAEGSDLGSLGLAYSDLGQVDKAIQYYEKALAISQEIGDRRNEGVWLGNLGSAYRYLGQVEKTIQYYEKALAIALEIRDRRGERKWLNNLGVIFTEQEKYTEALACYLLTREIRIQIKDLELKRTESNLTILKEKLGKKKFEKLTKEVEPAAEEIVRKMLERKTGEFMSSCVID